MTRLNGATVLDTAPHLGSTSGLSEDAQFAERATVVCTRLRDAMTRLIHSMPDPIRRAVDLQRSLDVYAELAWRVFKTANVDEPLQAIEYALTFGQTSTLLDAAKKKSVPAAVIADVDTAMSAYAAFIDTEAGSRDALRVMIASLGTGDADVIDEKCRKEAYRSNSLIWGARSDLSLSCMIVVPGEPGSKINHCVGIQGNVNNHKVRANTKKRFSSALNVSTSVQGLQTEILHEFSSPQVALLSGVGSPLGSDDPNCARNSYIEVPMGQRSPLTYFQTDSLDYPLDEPDNSNDEGAGVGWFTSEPTAVVHLEILTLAGMYDPRLIETSVFACAASVVKAYDHRSEDLLPLEITGVYLGAMTDVPPAAGLPRYTEMIEHVLRKKNWYGMTFDVYRCRLAYPIMHTLTRLEVSKEK